MTRLDIKLTRIRGGNYRPCDFIIADAKDGDMGPSITAAGPKRERDGNWTRHRTRIEFLDQIKAIIAQDIVDIMLVSASNLEILTKQDAFADSAVKPAFRANDTTDIWRMRGATYHHAASRPFRSVDLAQAVSLTDLGLYSLTFCNDIETDLSTLDAFASFRSNAREARFNYFLEVFNPNIPCGIDPEQIPFYVNDCIYRCLAGVMQANRPQFLKIPYNGPRALEELASHDPSLIVGVLGGSAGTTRDTFELLHQAERYGARVALFGRKINLAEDPLTIVSLMREVASGTVSPDEAVKAYHGTLQTQGIVPMRPLTEDLLITEAPLKQN